MSQSEELGFSRLRTFFWPVRRYELKKFLPMLLIFFLISFDYNVLRTLKDTLLITAESSGAEVIPFVKVWVMFPGSVVMSLFWEKIGEQKLPIWWAPNFLNSLHTLLAPQDNNVRGIDTFEKLQQATKDTLYQLPNKWKQTNKPQDFDPSDIQSYRGIIIDQERAKEGSMKSYFEWNPDYLFLTDRYWNRTGKKQY